MLSDHNLRSWSQISPSLDQIIIDNFRSLSYQNPLKSDQITMWSENKPKMWSSIIKMIRLPITIWSINDRQSNSLFRTFLRTLTKVEIHIHSLKLITTIMNTWFCNCFSGRLTILEQWSRWVYLSKLLLISFSTFLRTLPKP